MESLVTTFWAKSSVSCIITRVLRALALGSFKQDMVSLPTMHECHEQGLIFQKQSQFYFDEFIFGAIDSKEVKIRRPTEDSEAYFNRKRFHSVKLQIVCSSGTKIYDYFVGWPGSSDDVYAFRNSPIHKLINDNHFQGYRIIGDSAYPCSNALLCPYKRTGQHDLTPQQRQFNKKLSSLRQIVECTFGVMCQRWSRLNYINLSQRTCELIEIICCLHNFFIGK
jgi:hypothetical protein